MKPPTYSNEEMKKALDSLIEGSPNPDYDSRHIYGYKDDSHKCSMLQIVTATRILDYQGLEKSSQLLSESELVAQAEEFAAKHGPILNLQEVIRAQRPAMTLAAEFKRASPSKGDIAMDADVGLQAQKYASAGANIISVLTEHHWFRGTLEDMTRARLESTRPEGRPAILRKEFIANTYMIAEAAANGADTVLLIVAVLPQHLLKKLIDYSRSIGIEPLVEVHADEELNVALEAGAKVIGVNNRNLHTFQMDLSTAERVASQLRERGLTFHHDDPNAEYTVCALSGMSTAFDVDRYRQAGIGMCLIGESLMRAADPAKAIAGLCLHPDKFQEEMTRGGAGGAYTGGTKLVKICGTTNADDALTACRAGANLIGVIFVPKSKRCVTPEQAQEVVKAVRKFGERSKRTIVTVPKVTSPLPHLVAASRALDDAARRPMVVGVFQNQSTEFIREMVEKCGLDMVQLHGSEGMAAANAELYGVPTIRVVDVETDPETGKASEGAVQKLLDSITADPAAILLDTSIKGNKDGGGTGVTFDWSIAQQVQNAGLPVIIAGGLKPTNVQDAVGAIRPWGVDVSSGVEASPGKKDPSKVDDFVKNARTAEIEASKGF